MSQATSIRNGFIVFIALIGAIWFGVTIVTEQAETILKLAGSTLLITCVLLGTRMWLLLILFTALNVPLIRGFGTTELGQVLFIGFTVLMTLMRRQPYKITFGEKEIWMLLLGGCVLQVYFRNPVGLNMFGADAVGARPYFMIGMAFLSSIILGNIKVNPNELKWAFRLSMVGSILGIGLTSLRTRIFGSGMTSDVMVSGLPAARVGSAGYFGVALARIIAAYKSPLRALLHPGWGLLVLISFAAAAASGYRNFVASVGLIFLLGLAYRSGFLAVFVSSVIGAVALGFLAFINVVSPLPGTIQRALSPLPGTWEEQYVEAGEKSTEWRVEMWKEALFTEYWIQNKILGDGLGFTRRELILMADMESGGNLDSRGSSMTRQQESMMVSGNYHSGPVQTVRAVGYVGLVILILAMLRMAVHAHRQILRSRNTEWYPVTLYFGIYTIVQPIVFVFIVGNFGIDAARLFFSYAIVSLLEKNLPLSAYKKRSDISYAPNFTNMPKEPKTNQVTGSIPTAHHLSLT